MDTEEEDFQGNGRNYIFRSTEENYPQLRKDTSVQNQQAHRTSNI